MTQIHPIKSGAYCVPSAIQALTGADYESVIHPALNRHAHRANILELVGAERMPVAVAVLEELGYAVRRYKGTDSLRAHVTTWAKRALARYPGRALLVATRGHALVVQDGKVYDTAAPFGVPAPTHPYAKSTVVWAALVEKRM